MAWGRKEWHGVEGGRREEKGFSLVLECMYCELRLKLKTVVYKVAPSSYLIMFTQPRMSKEYRECGPHLLTKYHDLIVKV